MYNPFDLPLARLHELNEEHLGVLVAEKVSEGYWVEYKLAFPENQKIAKSIASFANTYGGWFFVGIEASSMDNAAQHIDGFSLTDVSKPVDRLHEIVKSYIDPIPLFYSTLIQLSTGNVVLVVHVPGEQETPFVNKDGRIYRRVAASSDPIPENDRYAVDRLVDNGRSAADVFERFCQDERTFSQSENGGWVNIFLSPYPLYPYQARDDDSLTGKAQRYQDLSLKPLPILMPDGQQYGDGNIPFDTVQTTARSIVLRQVKPGDFLRNSIEIELYFDGRAKFLIPLHYLPKWDRDAVNKVKSRVIAAELIPMWTKSDDVHLLDFFSIERLWSAIMVLMSYHWHWYSHEIAPHSTPIAGFNVAIHANNLWRSVPFLDSDEWGAHVQRHGLPVMTRDSFRYPRQGDRMLRTDIRKDGPLWMLVNGFVLVEFGLPESLLLPVISAAVEAANQRI